MEISAIIKKIGYLYSISTETPTSFALAREVVNTLPVDWSNSTLKILDLSCGRGNFLLAVAEKLAQFGHSREHIVKNMLYGVDIDNVQVMIAVRALGMFYNGNVNITKENSLEKVWNMKFDVVIGNPPYQDPTGQNTIYPKFYGKAISVCQPNGCIAMITPPAIIPGLWGVKDPDGIKMPSPVQIEKIKVGASLKNFFPGVSSDFCYFILKNTSSDNTQVTVVTDSGEVIASGPIFPRVSSNVSVAQSILNKCFSFYKDPYNSTSRDHGKSAKFDPHGIDFAVEAISTSGDVRTRPITWINGHDHYNKPKVILPMYGKVAIVDYSHKLVSASQEKTTTGKLTGHNIITVLTQNDQESESLVQILESRLQRFFNTVTCETRSPYVNFLKNFVGVPLNRKYTDDELETTLGLDDEQKKWLCENF